MERMMESMREIGMGGSLYSRDDLWHDLCNCSDPNVNCLCNYCCYGCHYPCSLFQMTEYWEEDQLPLNYLQHVLHI